MNSINVLPASSVHIAVQIIFVKKVDRGILLWKALCKLAKNLIVLYQMHNPLGILYFQWVRRPHQSFMIGHIVSVLASQFCNSSYFTIKLLHIQADLFPYTDQLGLVL